MGFSAGGVSAVGFIVKIGQSIRTWILLSLCAGANASLCPVASFYLLLACVAWCLDAYLGHAIATQTPSSSAYSLLALPANNDVSVTIPIGNGPLPLPAL